MKGGPSNSCSAPRQWVGLGMAGRAPEFMNRCRVGSARAYRARVSHLCCPTFPLLPSLAPQPQTTFLCPLPRFSPTDLRQEAHALQVFTAQASGAVSLVCFVLGHPRTVTSPFGHRLTAFLMKAIRLEHRGDFITFPG